MTTTGAARRASLLFVCTGNICRSPIAERVAARLGGDEITVSSAGTGALNGHAMHPLSAQVLTERGYDATGFESRYLRPPMLADIDIVLCLAREHRAACQRALPARWRRMFTLIEFAELAHLGDLDTIMAGRGAIDTNDARLDIADPMGRPIEDFERVFNEVAPRVEQVVSWVRT